jgi:hypothetical protein
MEKTILVICMNGCGIMKSEVHLRPTSVFRAEFATELIKTLLDASASSHILVMLLAPDQQ